MTTSVIDQAKSIVAKTDAGIREGLANTKRHVYSIALRDYLGKPNDHDALDLLEIIETTGMTLEQYQGIVEKTIPFFVRSEATKRRDQEIEQIEKMVGFLVRDAREFVRLLESRLHRAQNLHNRSSDPQKTIGIQKLRNQHPELFDQDEILSEILKEAIDQEYASRRESSSAYANDREIEYRRSFEGKRNRFHNEAEVPVIWDHSPDSDVVFQVISSLGRMMQERHQPLVDALKKLDGEPGKYVPTKKPSPVAKIATKAAKAVTKKTTSKRAELPPGVPAN